MAIGVNARAEGEESMALGYQSSASADYALAFGSDTRASAVHAVALGAGSQADQPHTVSVGRPGSERRITNVAPGLAGTDAVNVNQLNQSMGSIASNLDNKLDALSGDLRKYAARGTAAAMAMPSIPALAPGEGWAGMGVGTYGGQAAVGIGVAYQASPKWNIGLAVSTATSGGSVGARAQAGFKW